MSNDRKNALSESLLTGLRPLVGLFYCGGAAYLLMAFYAFPAAVLDEGFHARPDLGAVLIGRLFWGVACIGMARAVSCIIVVYEETKRIRERESPANPPAQATDTK